MQNLGTCSWSSGHSFSIDDVVYVTVDVFDNPGSEKYSDFSPNKDNCLGRENNICFKRYKKGKSSICC